MALGGGQFVTQNKVLPGSYINFVSASKASANLSDRGVVALPVKLDWGLDDEIITMTSGDLQKESLKILGYAYDSDKLKGLREMFKNIKTAHLFKLMNGGTKASNTFCDAKYKGVRGNDIKIVIAVNIDDVQKMDVSTYLDTQLVDKQTVAANTDNLADNDFVVWKSNVTLTANAGLPLTTGSNGVAVTGTQYQLALDKFETVAFNALGCLSTTDTIIDLFIAYTKRLRDQMGVKFKTIVYRKSTADYEGIISVENTVTDTGAEASSLVYWVLGAEAGCQVNKSNTNRIYDGEFSVDTNYKQTELEAGIEAGKFILHKVGDTVRVLSDINTFVSVTDDKSSDFSSNQTIRVMDQIANDIAVLFNTKYLGKVPNDASGRVSLWNDIVKHHEQLLTLRAIENFKSDDVQVEAGITKKSVVVKDVISIVNAMAKLYMTVVVE